MVYILHAGNGEGEIFFRTSERYEICFGGGKEGTGVKDMNFELLTQITKQYKLGKNTRFKGSLTVIHYICYTVPLVYLDLNKNTKQEDYNNMLVEKFITLIVPLEVVLNTVLPLINTTVYQ